MNSVPSESASPSTGNIEALGTDFRKMRSVKGHWEGGEYNELVDSPQGAKHTTMQTLGNYLGAPGITVQRVMELLGQPDNVSAAGIVVQQMPGPVIPADLAPFTTPVPNADEPVGPIRLTYNWRGNFSTLYFDVDPQSKTVLSSGWTQEHV